MVVTSVHARDHHFESRLVHDFALHIATFVFHVLRGFLTPEGGVHVHRWYPQQLDQLRSRQDANSSNNRIHHALVENASAVVVQRVSILTSDAHVPFTPDVRKTTLEASRQHVKPPVWVVWRCCSVDGAHHQNRYMRLQTSRDERHHHIADTCLPVDEHSSLGGVVSICRVVVSGQVRHWNIEFGVKELLGRPGASVDRIDARQQFDTINREGVRRVEHHCTRHGPSQLYRSREATVPQPFGGVVVNVRSKFLATFLLKAVLAKKLRLLCVHHHFQRVEEKLLVCKLHRREGQAPNCHRLVGWQRRKLLWLSSCCGVSLERHKPALHVPLGSCVQVLDLLVDQSVHFLRHLAIHRYHHTVCSIAHATRNGCKGAFAAFQKLVNHIGVDALQISKHVHRQALCTQVRNVQMQPRKRIRLRPVRVFVRWIHAVSILAILRLVLQGPALTTRLHDRLHISHRRRPAATHLATRSTPEVV